MPEAEVNLHRLRSTLSVIRMQLQIGGYPRELLLRELEEAIELLDSAGPEVQPAAEPVLRVGESVRVVVADDEPRLADVLARRLSREGLSTRSAHDLETARKGSAAARRQEVVILDLSLLEQATAEERSWVASVRPVVITGASRREAERLLAGIEPFAVVEKPFSSEELASLVRRRAAAAGG